jgi:RNA-directed DNA polymerase
VISPLLANIYFNRFLKAWRERRVGERLKARVIAYADDFVICCRGTAQDALDLTRRWMGSMKLAMNESKTSIRDAQREHFDFLGYTFGPQYHRPTGRRYVGVMPSRKAVNRLRERIREILRPSNVGTWEETARRVNRILRGWANYFSYGNVTRSYWWVDAFVLHRARSFLARRHKLPGRGTRRLRPEQVFGDGGLLWLAAHHRARTSHA